MLVLREGGNAKGGMTVYHLQRRGRNRIEKPNGSPKGYIMVTGDPFARSHKAGLAAQVFLHVEVKGTHPFVFSQDDKRTLPSIVTYSMEGNWMYLKMQSRFVPVTLV